MDLYLLNPNGSYWVVLPHGFVFAGCLESEQVMDAYGRISSQAALDQNGRFVGRSIEYARSKPLSSIQLDVSHKEQVTLVTEVEMNSGTLKFCRDSEDQVIRTSRDFSCVFKGHTLEKVNNDPDGSIFTLEDNFYPLLHKMLNTQKDWSTSLCFRGRATFEIGVMEWTEFILANFEKELNQAGIYGAVGVSRYPYQYCTSTWKAFLELWGPLTNTLHHGNGEMSISLYDLKLIGGLPISGIPYEELIPENKELQADGSYPTTLSELLCIHSQLCVSNRQKFVRWSDWIRHFYRGELLFKAYGEETQCVSQEQCDKFMSSRSALVVSKEGELAAFLAYWLSRFVLPSPCFIIRPETFHMACLMAQGIKVSLAPAVLGHIYHGLGEIVTCPRGAGQSRSCFPVHYVIGWLGEHFNCLYRRHADSEFLESYPHLARYAGVEAQTLDITSARLVFRTGSYVEYRPSPLVEPKGYHLIDDGNLSEEKFDFLICLRSALLPIRIGDELWLEPYYPNRFARQFGFDQGVPANRLQFKLEKRRKCGVENLAKAQRILLRGGTGIRFYIPRSSYNGLCTWTYSRWWMAACAPYLGRSVSFVYQTLKKRPLDRQSNIFVIKSLRDVSAAMPKKTYFPDFDKRDAAPHFEDVSPAESMCRETYAANSNDESRIGKRARYGRHDDFGDGAGEKGTAFPPAEHASDTNGAFYHGGDIGATRLKSVVVYDPKLKMQTSQPSLKGKHEDLERKLRAPGSKKMKPVPKKHGVKQSAKEIEHSLNKPASQEDHSKSPLSTFEPPIEDSESELLPPVPGSLQLTHEGTLREGDAELPLIGMEPDLSNKEPELLQLEWRSSTELKGTEPSVEGSSTPTINHSTSDSDVTEPIGSDTCEDVDEVICEIAETSSTLHEIFSSESDERWGLFIISEVEDILKKVSLSQPLELIIEHRNKVQKSLEMLRPVIKSYGTGEDRFERFASSVSKTFEFADKLSKDMLVIEQCSAIDTVRIRELIRSHEECQHAKEALHLELSGLTQELADLMATEKQIIEAEQRAQQLRERYELAKDHLEKKIIFLEDSADQQNKLDAELREARIEANEDQLVESEHLKDAYKVQEEEFKRLVNSLKFFGETPG